ncbi:lysophospholipid acyltransferase family protein [Flavicella sediminum]|uniref:lysophospholipid acyltransferase family protein n=1 Tax=Flavicella sediminum TaxID=2585141 RepID=UPI0011205A83|nr:lysophospholipid acyltransferase family protein [Flavicella sediminum]
MQILKKIISYPLSVLHYLIFGFFISLFHPIQWFTLKFFGYSAHKKSVDYLNYFLLWSLYVLGTKIEFVNTHKIPKNVPLIIVSNHQSANEISPISWYLRDTHPKFVSKIELGSGIPSVSFNLKHGGSVLIDRNDPRQALSELAKFGKSLEKNNWSGVIFPEGTRSKTGEPKRFSENGLKLLVKYAPSAYILPLTINNSWKLVANGSFPLGLGVKMKLEVHEPIAVNSMSFEDLFQKVEKTIKNSVTL